MTVQVSQLSNGLRVVSHRMAGLETATVGVFVNAGARAETDNEHGVAHFLEHMAFKGTPTRTPMQIAEEIEGAGGALNAVTSSETTNYYARVLKSDVELGLRLIADLLQNPAFSDDEMDREREVILQEIAATQDSPDDIAFDMALDEAYPNQALGRSILGTSRTIERHAAADLKRFRNENYAASRIILSAAGAIDHDTLHRLADELFGGMPMEAARPIKRARFEGGHAHSDKRFEQCHVIYAFEGFPNGHESAFSGRIFTGIAGGRHGVAAVSGGPRKAGALLRYPCLRLGLLRQRHRRPARGDQPAAIARAHRRWRLAYSPISPRTGRRRRSLHGRRRNSRRACS